MIFIAIFLANINYGQFLTATRCKTRRKFQNELLHEISFALDGI